MDQTKCDFYFRFLRFSAFPWRYPGSAQKKETYPAVRSGGTPIPAKTIQTEYVNIRRIRQDVVSALYFGVFRSESVLIDREMLFHLDFSRMFSPFVVEKWGNIALKREKYKPRLCLYGYFFLQNRQSGGFSPPSGTGNDCFHTPIIRMDRENLSRKWERSLKK